MLLQDQKLDIFIKTLLQLAIYCFKNVCYYMVYIRNRPLLNYYQLHVELLKFSSAISLLGWGIYVSTEGDAEKEGVDKRKKIGSMLNQYNYKMQKKKKKNAVAKITYSLSLKQKNFFSWPKPLGDNIKMIANSVSGYFCFTL